MSEGKNLAPLLSCLIDQLIHPVDKFICPVGEYIYPTDALAAATFFHGYQNLASSVPRLKSCGSLGLL